MASSAELEQACGAIKETHDTSVTVNVTSTNELVTSLESLQSTTASCSSPVLMDSNVQLLINSTALGSTLTMQQSQLDLSDVSVQANADMTTEGATFAECNDEVTANINGGEDGDAADITAPLGLPQTSLFLVNLPTQYVLQIDPSRSQQLLRLTQNATANLISATQESIAREFGNVPTKSAAKHTERVYKCEECSRVFKSHSHYRYHQETHKGNKVLKCNVDGCNRKFAWPAHLKYHLRTHQNDRPYACTNPHCQKQFYTVQSLKVHMRTHTGHKPFKCDSCQKCFTTAGNLKNHVRTHTGEKPYCCDFGECRLSFAEKSSLRKHKLTHTGDKPYECELCGKLFSQSGSRNAHKKRQHGVTLQKGLDLAKSDDHLNGTEMDRWAASVQQEAEMHLNVPTDLGQDQHKSSSDSEAPTSDTNVVLSQSQHTLSMVTGSQFADTQTTSTEDIVYTNALLQSGLEHHSAHDIPVSDDIEVGPGLQDSDIHHTHIVVGDSDHHKTIIGLEPLMESDSYEILKT